jgi:hypothetical protein
MVFSFLRLLGDLGTRERHFAEGNSARLRYASLRLIT